MVQQTPAAAGWLVREKSDQSMKDMVGKVLRLTQPPRQHERRRDQRTAFPHLITLTPIDDNELRVVDEGMVVVGKYLADRGIDFFHTNPFPHKRAIVSFDESMGLEAHFILNIGWCRFLRPGWYDSGGRFTHIVSPDDNISVSLL